MSIRLMTQVWDSEFPTNKKMVLLCLADAANDEGQCWPSVSTIVRRTGLSRATVFRHLRDLQEESLVECRVRIRDNGSRRSSMYTLQLGGSHSETGGVARCDGGGRTVRPLEPSLEPSLEPKNKTLVRETADPDFEDFWRAYPRKLGKAAAKKSWSKTKARAGEVAEGLEAWNAYWRATETEERFIPHATTFLNQRRYNDAPPRPPKSKSSALADLIAEDLADE